MHNNNNNNKRKKKKKINNVIIIIIIILSTTVHWARTYQSTADFISSCPQTKENNHTV